MSKSLLVRGDRSAAGEIVTVRRGSADWRYVDFRVMRLPRGGFEAGRSREDELVIVSIEGAIDVQTSEGGWPGVGGRSSPFDGPPACVYLPPDCDYRVEAVTDSEVAFCSAPARGRRLPARLISMRETDARVRGSGQAKRCVYNVLMEPDEASTLFVTEVLTPPGNWSSYPPHKHDVDDPPNESALEELYYYRALPASGFAFQRVYTVEGDIDETLTAHDGDVVLVPRGYHVCAAAPEYAIYYLNVLAGPKHVYHMTFDPAHEWIKKDWVW
ncbi:MAG TPA: 5-deoxy-glucuronate isomerase [Candidatus Baltobacteraceae bacterium]|nr:5-deoxy-glucuronate isomerase [Candidatus Baltobacteraceae bacterium]